MQKGISTLILLIIGLGIFGLVSILSFGLFKKPVPSLPLPPPAPEFVTYNNQDLGLEFTYSNKNFLIKEDSEEEFNQRAAGSASKSVNGNFRKNFRGYVQYEPGKVLGTVVVLDKTGSFDINPFTIWVFNNDNNLTIEEWYQKYWYYPFVWGDFTYTGKTTLAPKDEATVSGQLGKSGVIDYQSGKPKFIYVSKDKKMYLFRIIGDEGEKILSAFKFLSINQSDEKCVVGGCSGQLCLEVIEGMYQTVRPDQILTTCEWKEEYACYKGARCERQDDGKCAWTETNELMQCLKEKSTPVLQ